MRAKLGQNFLVDAAVRDRIVSLFNPEGEFAEIGPGHGEITELLIQKFKKPFVVFEKDRYLIENFHAQNSARYQTIAGDFLDWNFEFKAKPIQDFWFIGNLPYESGSMMVKTIAEHSPQVAGFLFMLQKEVVERICAQPKTTDFSSFSILVQGQFNVEALDIIPPTAFDPPPKVYSQLVRGKKRPDAHPLDRAYLRFLKMSFAQKRKTLRNAIKSFVSSTEIEALFQEFEFSSHQRAEEIPVDLWPKIWRFLEQRAKA